MSCWNHCNLHNWHHNALFTTFFPFFHTAKIGYCIYKQTETEYCYYTHRIARRTILEWNIRRFDNNNVIVQICEMWIWISYFHRFSNKKLRFPTWNREIPYFIRLSGNFSLSISVGVVWNCGFKIQSKHIRDRRKKHVDKTFLIPNKMNKTNVKVMLFRKQLYFHFSHALINSSTKKSKMIFFWQSATIANDTNETFDKWYCLIIHIETQNSLFSSTLSISFCVFVSSEIM